MTTEILNSAANTLQNIIKQLDEAADYIEILEAHLNRANERLEFYEQHCGTYEDIQAQAVAPLTEFVEPTLQDLDELTAQDSELTDEQKMYYYHQNHNA